MFEKIKEERSMKEAVIGKINGEITAKANSRESDASEVFALWEKKQTVKMNGLSMGDAAKIVANVVVVGVVIGFELGHVMNKNAMKFIRPL
jgi:hypothetical protein